MYALAAGSHELVSICIGLIPAKTKLNSLGFIGFSRKHDMGMKVSLYLASLYQFLFDELGQNKRRRIEFDKTENT
jgi:hypothetical protein